MHPTLFHLGHLAVSTEGVLVAFGLLAGLQLACLLAPQRGLDPDRIWNLGLVSLLTLFLGERMLVIAFNLRDFIAHPFWMLGLAVVRDERYFYGGVLLAICAGCGYILAWRLPWRSVLDTLAPGAGLALACLNFGALSAGTSLGRPATAAWGLTSASRAAAHVPLLPITLYAGLLHLGLAACAVWLCRQARPSGSAAAFWLFTAGLGTVLIDQLRYPTPAETLVGGVLTPAQSLGVLAVLGAAALWLRPAPGPEWETPQYRHPGQPA